MGKSGSVGVGGKSGSGGRLESGGFGVGGKSGVGGLHVGCRRVVRFDDDEGKGILDHDEDIHANIDHAADRLKRA